MLLNRLPNSMISEQIVAHRSLTDEFVTLESQLKMVNHPKDHSIQPPFDSTASPSDGPENKGASQESCGTKQNPVAERRGQTSSGITPVLSYWYAMALSRATRRAIGG
jgi:hypothetical protein